MCGFCRFFAANTAVVLGNGACCSTLPWQPHNIYIYTYIYIYIHIYIYIYITAGLSDWYQVSKNCFKSLQRTSTLIRLGVVKTNDGVSCSDCSQHLHYIPPALQFIIGDFLSIGGGLEMLLTVKFDIQIDAIPMHVKMVLMMMETMRRNSNLFFHNWNQLKKCKQCNTMHLMVWQVSTLCDQPKFFLNVELTQNNKQTHLHSGAKQPLAHHPTIGGEDGLPPSAVHEGRNELLPTRRQLRQHRGNHLVWEIVHLDCQLKKCKQCNTMHLMVWQVSTLCDQPKFFLNVELTQNNKQTHLHAGAKQPLAHHPTIGGEDGLPPSAVHEGRNELLPTRRQLRQHRGNHLVWEIVHLDCMRGW